MKHNKRAKPGTIEQRKTVCLMGTAVDDLERLMSLSTAWGRPDTASDVVRRALRLAVENVVVV